MPNIGEVKSAKEIGSSQHCNYTWLLCSTCNIGKWEIVHHINKDKRDNRIENLELLNSADEHIIYTRMEIRIKQLEQRVTLLESENEILKSWLTLRKIS